jgi:hypothetical protein
MCAVIFPFIRRLFSSFVLTCFLCTTLFQTIAFADYTRAQADSVVLDEQNDITYAHLNVGVQKIERSPSSTAKGGYVFDVNKTTSETPEFIVPFGKTHAETQRLIDQTFVKSTYEQPTIVEEGLTWTSHGVDFYRYNSGDVFPSKSLTPSDDSDPLHMYNQHGATIFKDDFTHAELILSGKDILQKANMSLDTLSLHMEGTFVNEKYLSVSSLLFGDSNPSSRATSPLSRPHLINNGLFIGKNRTEESFPEHDPSVQTETLPPTERVMPSTDNACAFYCFDLEDKNGTNVRQQGVKLLLEHAANADIRGLVAFEIRDKIMRNVASVISLLPEAQQQYQKLILAKKALETAVNVANTSKGTTLTAQQLLALDPNEKDKALIPVQLKLQAFDAVKADIRVWATLETTYRAYVGKYLAQPNIKLDYFNDISLTSSMTSSMDALAKILGIDLKIFVKDDANAGKLVLAHAFTGGNKKSINMIHVAHNPRNPGELNHLNRLEEPKDKPNDLHTTRTTAPETTTSENKNADFVFTQPTTNTGTMRFEKDVMLNDIVINTGTMHFEKNVTLNDLLTNEGSFESEKCIQGNSKALSNQGTFHAKQGFKALKIQEFLNDTDAVLRGDGKLILGTKEFNAVNKGKIESSRLALQLNGDFFNSQSIHADDVLETSGDGTFYQQGILTGKKAVINNKQFENQTHLDQPNLDLSFGDKLTTFTNDKECVLKTKSVSFASSTSKTASATNEGMIDTGHFTNAIPTFINKQHIIATAWDQNGMTFTNTFGSTIDVSGPTQFNVDRIHNNGDITTSGGVKGKINHFINTGGFTIHEEAILTGKQATNEKTIHAHRLFNWKGESFTSTPHSTLHGKKLDVTTTKPLILNGNVQSDQGAIFTAPSIQNQATFITKKGQTHFNGVLSNQRSINVDELVYETADTLTNAPKASLTANLYTRTRILNLLDNSGTIDIHSGGFHAHTVKNSGKMNLLNGTYHIDTLNNKEGDATIDRLSLTSRTPTIEGKLSVKQFVPSHEVYQHIQINGTTTLESGDFQTKELTINGTLTLGKGHYRITLLKGDRSAKLFLQRGAHVTIGGIEYNGDIESSVNLTLNLPASTRTSTSAGNARTLLANHRERRSVFNALPSASPADTLLKKTTIFDKTQAITDILAGGVSSKTATDAERKTILQAAMGSEITALIHSKDQQEALSLEKKLSALKETDVNYRHYKILGLTAKLSRLFTQQVSERGVGVLDSIQTYVHDFDADNETICSYSGLKRDMFMLWFHEVIDQHKEGFPAFKKARISMFGTAKKENTYTHDAAPTLHGDLKEVSKNHSERRSVFNSLFTASPNHALHAKTIVFNKTNTITHILAGGVSSKTATDVERKAILQAAMGSEITALIHSKDSQEALSLEKKLSFFKETDANYRHYKILGLTAKLSRLFTQQVSERGVGALDSMQTYVHDFDADNETICSYSGLKRDMFMLWFREVLEQHKEGFHVFKKSLAPTVVTRENVTNYIYGTPHATPGGLKEVSENHIERRSVFNALPSASPTNASLTKTAVFNKTNTFTNIMTGSVSSRLATYAELKTVLQATMGSEITALIHDKDKQDALSLEKKLPVLTETDVNYKHFKILSLTAKLSRLFTQQVSEHGIEALDSIQAYVHDFDADNEILCKYAGLKRDMFMLWFREVLEEHKEGFQEPTATLTFAPQFGRKSADLSRIHLIKTKKDLILTSPHTAAAEDVVSSFLTTNKHKLEIPGALFLKTNTFSNLVPLDLPYHVHFYTHLFKPQKTLTVKGMTLRSSHAQIGSDNDHMVKIVCDGSMDAQVEHDFDVRFGLLQSTDSGRVKSKSGKILIGARKNVSDKRVEKNGAMITSTYGKLILEALSDGIYNHFGVVKGQTLLHYKAKKLENISSDGVSHGAIVLDVDDLDHLILDEIHKYDTGRRGQDGIVRPSRTESWGHGHTVTYGEQRHISGIWGQLEKAGPSTLRAMGGNITVNCQNAPKIFGSHFQTYGSLLWRHTNGAFIDVPGGNVTSAFLAAAQLAEVKSLVLNDYFPENNNRNAGGGNAINPLFTAAVNIDFDFSKFNLLSTGAATGQHIVIRANGMQIVNANGVRQPTRNQSMFFNVAAAANQHVNTPLNQTQTHGQTTYHTQNVPGARNDAPNIAVLNTTGNRRNTVPRSFFSSTESSGDRFNPTQYKNVFDKDTLENIIMTLQQVFTGGFHGKGSEFLTFCIQNGHEYKRKTEALSTEEAIKQADKAMIGYIPEETPEGTIIYDLWSFFTANMHVPYAGTSGNVQASDRVEILADSDGIHEDGATVGSGEGGILYKTKNKGNYTATSQTKRTHTGNGHVDSIGVSTLSEANKGDIEKDIDGIIHLTGAVDHEAGKGTTNPHKLVLSGKGGVFGIETMLEE